MSEEQYRQLIYEKGLYELDFIKTFGENGTHWARETWKSRELSLRHDQVCVYLCNLETKTHNQMVEGLARIGEKRKVATDTLKEIDEKRQKLMDDTDKDLAGSSSGPSTSSSSSSTHDKKLAMDAIIGEEIYRLVLLEGMPNVANIQARISRDFGCNAPREMWDIADLSLKKFIEVKVTNNFNAARLAYRDKSENTDPFTALCVVDPQKGSARWLDHPGKLKGESKVKSFILSRTQALLDMKMVESELQESIDLVKDVFSCDWLDGLLEEWKKDFYPEEISEEKVHENYVGETKTELITPGGLLKNLKGIEMNGEKFVKWKGKLLPACWDEVMETKEELDRNIVDQFFQENIELINSEFRWIYDTWETSNKNTFNLRTNEDSLLKKKLGIGAKPHVMDMSEQEVYQPEYSKIECLNYHPWIEWIIEDLGGESKVKFFPEIEKDIADTQHPISTLANDVTRVLLKKMCLMKTAQHSSKMSGFYSRLGGAYSNEENVKTHSNIAVFPIYATGLDENEERVRLVSGVCFRGQQHCRRSTDKINIYLIEKMLKSEETKAFIDLHQWDYIECENGYLVMRQNAINREDPSYLAFINNAMFLPANLLGVMYVEDPDMEESTSPTDILKKIEEDDQTWVCERYTEGVLMASIANSRDEGYFSMLRKLFMIVLQFRRQNLVACLDVEGLCEKVNECIIDNPFSMYYHQTLLSILKYYVDRYNPEVDSQFVNVCFPY
nr:TPA_asm: polymerase PA [Cotesiavirus orthomyxi]